MSKEITNNMMTLLLSATSINGQSEQLEDIQKLQEHHIQKAVVEVSRHDLVPDKIVMSVPVYVSLRLRFPSSISAPPLPLAIDSKKFGFWNGVPILADARIQDSLCVLARPDDVGVFWKVGRNSFKLKDNINKSSIEVAATSRLSLVVINDYGIASIVFD
jgi:hypothetical protein